MKRRDGLLGGLMVVIGVLCLMTPRAAGMASIRWLGVFIAASGILGIAAGLGRAREGRSFTVGGVLSVVVGLVLIARPGVALAIVALAVAVYLFASGLVALVPALVERGPGWGWDLAFGVASVALGGVLVATWRTGGAWLLGIAVGVEIIARGASLIGARRAPQAGWGAIGRGGSARP
jgi:uncharacterized membrane protein HdeD (DUF308 family)